MAQPTGIKNIFQQNGQNIAVHLQERIQSLELEIETLRNGGQANELEARIEELTQQLASGGERQIPIDSIHPDPNQPRTIFPESVIAARAKSLRENGQLNPIILVQVDDGYQIFDGELRWRAASQAGLETLRAVFMPHSDSDVEVFDRQLVTGLESQKLHPLELAIALKKLTLMRYPSLDEYAEEFPSLLNSAFLKIRRQDKVAELESIRIADSVEQSDWVESLEGLSYPQQIILKVILGKQLNPGSVSVNVFPLLNLPEDLQKAAQRHGIDASKIRELAKVSDEGDRAKLIKQVLDEDMPLSEIKAQVKQLKPAIKDDSPLTSKERFATIYQRVKTAKVWDDPQKAKKLEKLLNQLEDLID